MSVVVVNQLHIQLHEKLSCREAEQLIFTVHPTGNREAWPQCESEVNTSFNELGVRTLLHQSGIRKDEVFPPVTLLFVLIVLPLIK